MPAPTRPSRFETLSRPEVRACPSLPAYSGEGEENALDTNLSGSSSPTRRQQRARWSQAARKSIPSRVAQMKPTGAKHAVLRMTAAAVAATVPSKLFRSRSTFDIWERHGYHVTPCHFYEPIPDTSKLPDAAWESYPIELESRRQLELVAQSANYDIAGLEGRHGFTFSNPYFTGADAAGLYTVIREYKPSRVIEIGSGFSTRVTQAALEDNGHGELVTVEPYQTERMAQEPTYRVPAQQLPFELFSSLAANDVLFIDSSHVATLGSDVTHLILRVLPQLHPGVLVHFHDIFLPDEYPRHWTLELRRFWNEQYLVGAFLLFNREFEVIWASNYLRTRYPDKVNWPTGGSPSPAASLWIRRLE